MKALWNGTVIAESQNILQLEQQIYFPKSSLNKDLFKVSPDTSFCSVKGPGKYMDLVVNGRLNANAACCYNNPTDNYLEIKGMVIFNKEIEIK